MALLHILQYPHPGLREKALPVSQFDKAITKLAEDMLETMYQAPGIGLAATQVNHAIQLLVIDTSETKNEPLVIINPEITEYSDEVINEEGCLSFPDIYANIPRFEQVTINYKDIDGKDQQLKADGLLAICIQHEMDHLQGKVFVDYLSSLKRNRIRKQLEKQQTRRNG
ncbi:MAG: peptide deformylase [Gammaproteobacteria bacterium]|nr:peptide deformylase [Gammaproteobacteria bacterium]